MNILESKMPRLAKLLIAAPLMLIAAGVCSETEILRLSTTTSTANSGLIEKLIPVFEEKFEIEVHTIVGGTGRALNHARNGDVDIIIVHAKEAELELVDSGYGVDRQEFMYNEFVVVGPMDDPAGIGGTDNLAGALKKIADSDSNFVSRGDESGTHTKEQRLWDEAGVTPAQDWYKEVGLGMGKALQIADELRAYILTDKGTWLSMKDRLSLPVHVQGAHDGKNVYGIIAVNPEIHPQANYQAASKLVQWIKSEESQSIIENHRVGGEQLFYVID